jgi:hypothetical protein
VTGDEIDFADIESQKAATAVLTKIDKDLSQFSMVTVGDNEIPVNNEWIAKSIISFSAKQDADQKKRIVSAVAERLDAIVMKIGDLYAAESRQLTKDEEKQRLAEILNREEYLPADAENESLAARFLKYISDWLNSMSPKPQAPLPGGTGDMSVLKTALQTTILILAISLIAFVLFRFGPLLIERIRGRKKTTKRQQILGEEIAADATTDDLFMAAEELARDGDIRGAIRKGYISLLFELSQRKMIGLAKHKTNRDYLGDLKKYEPIRKRVGGLTSNYERHWYGSREAGEGDWDVFKTEYRETLKR